MNIDLSAMGTGFGADETKIEATEGESVIRCQGGILWNRFNLPAEDTWKPQIMARQGGLALTNKRLIFLRPKAPVMDAKIWLEVPVNRIQRMVATHRMHPVSMIMVPINLILAALTQRLEIEYGDTGELNTVRFHVSNPKAWVEAFAESTGPTAR
jgi:hypothetical protein